MTRFQYEIDDQSCFHGSWGNIRLGCTLETDPIKAISRPWRILAQVHSASIYNDDQYEGPSQKGDGLVTDLTAEALAVKTADCVPVLISDGKRLGAVHAGWRGFKAGIVSDLAQYFQMDQCLAVVGPCISAQHYEVDKDLYEDWLEQDPRLAQFLGETEPGSSKRLFDLKGMVADQLTRMGTGQVEVIPVCTYQSSLPSYRRDAPHRARIYHYIHHQTQG